MRIIRFILDSIFLTRPVLHYPVWIFALAGIWGARHLDVLVASFSIVSVLLALLALSAIMGTVYILNQLQDIETDRANGKEFLIANDTLSIKHGYFESLVLIVFGLLIGLLIDWKLCFLLFLLLFEAGWLYNYPPASWKNRPVWDVLGNGLGGLIIYAIGWKCAGGQGWIPIQGLAYFFAGMSVTLNTMLPDMEGDKKTGKISFAVRYGVKTTAWTAFIFVIMTVAMAYYFQDTILTWASIAVTPLFVWSVCKPSVSKSLRATKFSIITLAFAIMLVFPWYLLPAMMTFFGTKWYYKWRFNFHYPKLAELEPDKL